MPRLTLLVAILLVLMIVGCDQTANTPPTAPDDAQPQAMEIPDDVLSQIQPYLEVVEPMPRLQADWPSVLPPHVYDPNFEVYEVTAIWGNLANSSGSNVTTDWTGRLEVNTDSYVDVVYEIDFEPGQDSIIPHDNPSFAWWISFTQGDFDGVSTRIFIPRENDMSAMVTVAPIVTFDTPPVTLSWSIYELADFAAIYVLNDGNAVAIIARRLWPADCPGGKIEGEWIRDPTNTNSGYLSGAWYDYNGEPVGIMSGIWHVDNDGRGHILASLSGWVTDQVIAEIRGGFAYDDYRLCPLCGDGHGAFWAVYRYLDRNSGSGGHMKGVFGDWSYINDTAAMPLTGVWQDFCPPWTNADFKIVRDGQE